MEIRPSSSANKPAYPLLAAVAAASLFASCQTVCQTCHGTEFIRRPSPHSGKIRSERCPDCQASPGIMRIDLTEGLESALDIADAISRAPETRKRPEPQE